MYPTPVVFYSVDGGMRWGAIGRLITGDIYRKWLQNLLKELEIPQIISISYSHSKPDLPSGYVYSLCQLFTQLEVVHDLEVI